MNKPDTNINLYSFIIIAHYNWPFMNPFFNNFMDFSKKYVCEKKEKSRKPSHAYGNRA